MVSDGENEKERKKRRATECEMYGVWGYDVKLKIKKMTFAERNDEDD